MRTHEYPVWKHNNLPRCAATWADNAVVETLSNFHTAVVIEDTLLRQGMNDDGNWENDQALVDALE